MPGAGWPSSADNVVGGPCVRRALAKAGSLFRSVDRGFQALRKCRDLEELVCVETTFLTSSSPFTEPAREGGSQLNEEANPFELAIDIFQCRKQHIRPLDLGEGASDYEDEPLQSQTADLEVGETPAFQDEVTTESIPAKPTDRMATWKRRLLDLTPRNKMLNFKVGSTSIELECPDPIKLESLKGKRCCRQVKFYCGVSPLTSRWSCLSRILRAGPRPWSYQILKRILFTGTPQ
jgi:hypothetical protein